MSESTTSYVNLGSNSVRISGPPYTDSPSTYMFGKSLPWFGCAVTLLAILSHFRRSLSSTDELVHPADRIYAASLWLVLDDVTLRACGSFRASQFEQYRRSMECPGSANVKENTAHRQLEEYR